MTEMSSAELSLLDQVRAIALEGLKYASNPYDDARYNKLLDIASQRYAMVLDMDVNQLKEQFRAEIGVVTPKIGVDAAVLNTKNHILVLKRTDDHSWCLPCGWVDVGETPAEAAMRETEEETGLRVEPLGYISVSHKGPHTASHLQHQVNIITLMKPVEDEASITLSHEHSEYKWVHHTESLNWHAGHETQFERIVDFLARNPRYVCGPAGQNTMGLPVEE